MSEPRFYSDEEQQGMNDFLLALQRILPVEGFLRGNCCGFSTNAACRHLEISVEPQLRICVDDPQMANVMKVANWLRDIGKQAIMAATEIEQDAAHLAKLLPIVITQPPAKADPAS